MYPYDPWQKCKTISGLAADLVISALQKEIRRNNEENAALLAYEMLATSAELEEYMWQRLKVISVEDVGFGDLSAPVVVNSLYTMRKDVSSNGDRSLFAIHAVRFLASRTKDRSSDELLNWIIYERQAGRGIPTIPEYAVDKHTLEGQKRGKDVWEFYTEGALVSPELPTRDKTYHDRIVSMLEREGRKG